MAADLPFIYWIILPINNQHYRNFSISDHKDKCDKTAAIYSFTLRSGHLALSISFFISVHSNNFPILICFHLRCWVLVLVDFERPNEFLLGWRLLIDWQMKCRKLLWQPPQHHHQLQQQQRRRRQQRQDRRCRHNTKPQRGVLHIQITTVFHQYLQHHLYTREQRSSQSWLKQK